MPVSSVLQQTSDLQLDVEDEEQNEAADVEETTAAEEEETGDAAEEDAAEEDATGDDVAQETTETAPAETTGLL